MSANDKKTISAYILINIKLGFTEGVIAKLKEIPGITSVAVITGEYDAIVRLETDSLKEMHERTLEIHVIDGIIETTTSIIQVEFT
ncbi:MAG: Lrp/AsnC ligand binding domain-containing protein [Candidatus Heimdallarchaeota archaeon]|nr:Lrp/AsnC ligand binding domain-containing protein [Candidatus Heimdallarchaeota archaeon]MBY8993308.1 Lrp/AsnC ligand binding domain-containing protein [Candidatus Heimdallarchaeota archaeon]